MLRCVVDVAIHIRRHWLWVRPRLLTPSRIIRRSGALCDELRFPPQGPAETRTLSTAQRLRWLTPRFIAQWAFAGAVGLGLLTSCGGDGSGTQPLAITAASPPAGTTGPPYPGYTFLASGGAPPLSWTESGPLPPGLALSASGQLSGSPTSAGKYPISITVTDSSMPTAHGKYVGQSRHQ